MSNYPLSYKISWPLRFLQPSVAGRAEGFLPAHAKFLPPPARSVRLAFVGDISAVANRRAPACDAQLATLLASADLVVGNCESPVVARPRAGLRTRLGTHHAMTSEFLAGAIAAVGIEPSRLVVSLANNHVLDQGIEGYDETLAALAGLGIRTIGTQAGLTSVTVGSLRIGFAAFTQWRNADAVSFAGRAVMADEFFAARGNGNEAATDLTCVVPHWDWKFRHFPHASTRALALRLAEMGVGLVVGHHAHVVQPVERIGETVVAYGLGDFLGTAFARQPWPGRIGAILVAEVSADDATRGRTASIRMVPFYRERDGDRERLVPLEAVSGSLGAKAQTRWATIFGPS
ncbi:MAG: metallophosphatase [Mesorhizobium sp. SCN 65-20]|nr:MAG: metallophosphatase [Mesorhizobium sp. SCN 65-20]